MTISDYTESYDGPVRMFYANINFSERNIGYLARFGMTYLFSMPAPFWTGGRDSVSVLYWRIPDPVCLMDHGKPFFIPQYVSPSLFKLIETNIAHGENGAEFTKRMSNVVERSSHLDFRARVRFMDEFNARFELETAVKGIDCGNTPGGENP